MHIRSVTPQSIPFIIMHFIPLLAIFTGVRWFDIWLCLGFYLLRMFFVTAGYHRYFAHRTYSLNRFMQFVMAFGGTLAIQKGPLWWASHHRNHHSTSDTEDDIHSPKKGFWWSHMGWILSGKYDKAPLERIPDFSKFPELRFLDRYYLLPPIAVGALFLLFWGPSALLIGFFLSTLICSHCTYFINSLSHLIGYRKFATPDASRNNFFLALITLGEGWHNNHHHFASSTKQGFSWWQIDITYYCLKIMSLFGLAKNLRTPPALILQTNLIPNTSHDIGLLKFKLERARVSLARAKDMTSRSYLRRKDKVEALMHQIARTTEQKLHPRSRVGI